MSDEREHLLKLQTQHKKNLQVIEWQIAQHGMTPPLYLVNQREHEQKRLADIEAQLAALTDSSSGKIISHTVTGASATTGGVAVVGDGNIIVVGGMEGNIAARESDDDAK